MSDRAELMEAAFGIYPEGIALLGLDDHLAFWNHAAEIITGYGGADLLGRHAPAALEALAQCHDLEGLPLPGGVRPGRGTRVHVQHKMGHDLPLLARKLILRDGLGARIGSAAVFHVADQTSALPHGDTCEGSEVLESQAELQERLEVEFLACAVEQIPLGVLWITVDQARELRKTHGARASEAMLENVERTLANALRPGDEIGRWGDDEFLILAHDRSGEVLAGRGTVLAGLARTADFRWWGDRASLTVSIGAAAAQPDETLAQLLERAQAAMIASIHAGGNHCSLAPGRK